MKINKIIVITFLVLVTCISSVFAIPYASQLNRDSSTIPTWFGYFLNQAADSALIIIKDVSTDSVAASFTGTASVGQHQISWDGTNNNAGGAPIPPGTYKFEVRVIYSGFSAWTEYASNKTAANTQPAIYATLPTGYPGRGIANDSNPANETYGLVYATQAPTASLTGHGILRFNPDLSLYAGVDLVLNTPDGVWDTPGAASAPWGVKVADDGELWICGQPTLGLELARGQWNGTTPVDVDVDSPDVGLPRGLAIQGTGAGRVLYWAEGGLVKRVAIGTNTDMTGLSVDTVVSSTIYSRHVCFDDGGNMYWLARSPTSTDVSYLFRWNASQVAGGPFPLDTTSATWVVTLTSTAGTRANGLTIVHNDSANLNDDDIYILIMGTLAEKGIYKVGVSGTGSNFITLTGTDIVVIPAEINTTSATSFDLTSDKVGNLIYASGSNEEAVRGYSPPGASDKITPAPTAKQFSIPILSVSPLGPIMLPRGGSQKFTASDGSGNYTWTLSTTGIVSLDTAAGPIVIATAVDSGTVILTCNDGFDPILITINVLPTSAPLFKEVESKRYIRFELFD
jgi:hypothetical protein